MQGDIFTVRRNRRRSDVWFDEDDVVTAMVVVAVFAFESVRNETCFGIR